MVLVTNGGADVAVPASQLPIKLQKIIIRFVMIVLMTSTKKSTSKH